MSHRLLDDVGAGQEPVEREQFNKPLLVLDGVVLPCAQHDPAGAATHGACEIAGFVATRIVRTLEILANDEQQPDSFLHKKHGVSFERLDPQPGEVVVESEGGRRQFATQYLGIVPHGKGQRKERRVTRIPLYRVRWIAQVGPTPRLDVVFCFGERICGFHLLGEGADQTNSLDAA